MFAPPGIDSDSSGEDVSPIISPDPSPAKAKFSFKSFFRPPKLSTPTPQPLAASEMDSNGGYKSHSPDKLDENGDQPRFTLPKLRKKVRILAKGDESPTTNQGELAMAEVPAEDKGSEDVEIVPGPGFEKEDPKAVEMLILLRQLVAKQQERLVLIPVTESIPLKPETELNIVQNTQSENAKSGKKLVPPPVRPPRKHQAQQQAPHSSNSAQLAPPGCVTPRPPFTAPAPGSNDTYYHPDRYQAPTSQSAYPVDPAIYINQASDAVENASPTPSQRLWSRQASPWSAPPWQFWQASPSHESTPPPANVKFYPPPMYPHPQALRPWQPCYQPHHCQSLHGIPPQSYYSGATNVCQNFQAVPQRLSSRLHDTTSRHFLYQPGHTPDYVHSEAPGVNSPSEPLANPWSPARYSPIRSPAETESRQQGLSTDIHRSLPVDEKKDQADSPKSGRSPKMQEISHTRAPLPDGISSLSAPAGCEWTKALVSLANCIDLAYSLLNKVRSGLNSGDETQAVLRLIVALAKTIGGGNDIPGAFGDIFGDRAAGELFEKELRVIAGYFVQGAPLSGPRRSSYRYERGESRACAIAQSILSDPRMQDILQGWSLTAYLAPSVIEILVDIAIRWKDGELSLKVILKSVLAIRSELARAVRPPQSHHMSLLNSLAATFSKQLKHQPLAPSASASSPTTSSLISKVSHQNQGRAGSTSPKHAPSALKAAQSCKPSLRTAVEDDSSDSSYSESDTESLSMVESDVEASFMLALADHGPRSK